MERLELDYLKPETSCRYEFYLIPKLLIDLDLFDGIDYGSKLLYSLMLSRAGLSARNADNFTDDNGNLFIIYTLEQVMNDMRCSEPTAVKMLKQLDEKGLIEKKRQGQGKPSLIYVKDFASIKFLNLKFLSSRTKENEVLELKNFYSKYNDSIYNDSSNPSIDQSDPKPYFQDRSIDTIDNTYDIYMDVVKTNIEYDMLIKDERNFRKEEIDEIVNIMVETICTTLPTVRIGREDKPLSVVKTQLLKLDREHIEYIYDCLKNNTTNIKNIRSYLLTSLYSAPLTINLHYKSKTNHDLFVNNENNCLRS